MVFGEVEACVRREVLVAWEMTERRTCSYGHLGSSDEVGRSMGRIHGADIDMLEWGHVQCIKGALW